MLLQTINNSLDELADLLKQLPDEEYSRPCPDLSGASIGEHTRHIVEMFECLLDQYASGTVNYDLRKRNLTMQTSTGFAIGAIQSAKSNLDRPNRALSLQQHIDGNEIRIESNYFRELLYNLEHCVHHQALIKVGLLHSELVEVDENFGVARSTIEYRKQCAQ